MATSPALLVDISAKKVPACRIAGYYNHPRLCLVRMMSAYVGVQITRLLLSGGL